MTTKDSESSVAYIRDNFEADDRVAIVLLSKRTGAVLQRVTSAEKIAAPEIAVNPPVYKYKLVISR